jgi:hypothetical protein
MKMAKAKIIIVVSSVLLLSTVALPGVKQDTWIMDDFESYAADPNTIHASSLDGPGWWTVQELEEMVKQIIPPDGFVCQLSLAMGDPNGFMASDEVDADGPMSMRIHYELPSDMTEEGYSCDAFIFAHNLGLPFELVYVGHPAVEYLAAVDLTPYDKISLKMKKLIGNKSTPTGDFTVGFMGTDMEALGVLLTVQPSSVPVFMEYPEDVWEVYEFALDSAQFPLDSVAGITFGTFDVRDTAVTYLIDEITFYKDSAPCPLHKGGDMNLDCAVNILDFVILSEDWMSL